MRDPESNRADRICKPTSSNKINNLWIRYELCYWMAKIGPRHEESGPHRRNLGPGLHDQVRPDIPNIRAALPRRMSKQAN
jgi:hypothetical protein